MTPLIIRITIISDATTWSIIYDRHSDDCNIFIILVTVFIFLPSIGLIVGPYFN
jgi:hypothetical protein